jgi:hypothetical protein
VDSSGDDYEADPMSVQGTFDLADAVPVLRPILDEHIAFHDEVLPHVVWADFRDKLVDLAESADDGAVSAFLDVVERLAASQSDAVRNLIEIIFLEDGLLLSGGRENAVLTGLQPRFGPATRALLAEAEGRLKS